MSDQNVFDNNSPQETPAPQETPSVDNVFADQLASIRNEEGKPKYDSVEEALKGAAHAQEYISQLKQQLSQAEQEKQSLASELGKLESVDEVVKRLTASKDEEPKETPATPSLDEQTVEQLINNALENRTQQATKQSNFEKVQSALIDKFGDAQSAALSIQEKAKELGMAPQDLGELAKERPNMVLELFKTSDKTNTPKPNVSSSLTSELQPKTEELEAPTKSLLVGATSQEQKEYMQKVKADVYKRLGVTPN